MLELCCTARTCRSNQVHRGSTLGAAHAPMQHPAAADPDCSSGARAAMLEGSLSCLWPSNTPEDVIRSVLSGCAMVAQTSVCALVCPALPRPLSASPGRLL